MSNKRMTRREALLILFDHTGKNCVGMGLGIRSITEKDREEGRAAVKRLWRDVYDWDASDSDLRNLGF